MYVKVLMFHTWCTFILLVSINGFDVKLIDVNRTCKVTKGGQFVKYTAMLACGNYNGVVGFAKAKGPAVPVALQKKYSKLCPHWGCSFAGLEECVRFISDYKISEDEIHFIKNNFPASCELKLSF